MIYRGLVGKEFPTFSVEVPGEFSQELSNLVRTSPCPDPQSWPPLCNWPSFMTQHGAACLMGVWEDLGVDPLELRLVSEEFLQRRPPLPRETLTGRILIEDVSDHLEPSRGIEEQVDLLVRFFGADGAVVAEYRCAYRTPVARVAGS